MKPNLKYLDVHKNIEYWRGSLVYPIIMVVFGAILLFGVEDLPPWLVSLWVVLFVYHSCIIVYQLFNKPPAVIYWTYLEDKNPRIAGPHTKKVAQEICSNFNDVSGWYGGLNAAYTKAKSKEAVEKKLEEAH